MANWISQYCDRIKDGSVIAGNWIRLLYKHIEEGLENGSFFFDQKKADKVIDWIENNCYHTEGPLAPGLLKLELWQKAILSAMYGIVDKNGKRQFREVVLVVSRKNGKSLFGAAIANYEWKNGGYGTRVFCIAPKLDQTAIIYDSIWNQTMLSPKYQKFRQKVRDGIKYHERKTVDDSELPKHRQTDLYIAASNSTVKKVAFSEKRSDGFNPSLTICDEVAAWVGEKGIRQYEVMKSAMGAREMSDEPPFLLSCTTSGYVNDGIYDTLISRATRVLLGDSEEKRLLPFLYMSDNIEKWDTYEELAKSNPNLGVSVSWDYLKEEIAVARGSLSKKAEFIVKYNCIKQNSSQAWLSTETVGKCIGEHLELEDFRNSYAVGGIDLSQTTDLTSACVLIERGGKIYVFSKFWLPAERIDEATERDGVPYRIMLQRGLLEESGENFIDYKDCFRWFRSLVEDYQIYPLKVGYDRYNSTYLTNEMKEYGFHMDDVYQGDNLWPVIQETEGLMKDGTIAIGDNDLLKIHMLDSAVKMNTERGKGKLVKLRPNAHIDGMAAILDAMTMRSKWSTEIGDQLRNEE